MKLESFFENFDLLSDAPNAVAKFRQLILELAVRGMLVPQDPEDENALALVERIKEDRQFKMLPSLSVEDAPFDLPEGWAWARFPELGEFGRGKSKHRPRNDLKLYSDG